MSATQGPCLFRCSTTRFILAALADEITDRLMRSGNFRHSHIYQLKPEPCQQLAEISRQVQRETGQQEPVNKRPALMPDMWR